MLGVGNDDEGTSLGRFTGDCSEKGTPCPVELTVGRNVMLLLAPDAADVMLELLLYPPWATST